MCYSIPYLVMLSLEVFLMNYDLQKASFFVWESTYEDGVFPKVRRGPEEVKNQPLYVLFLLPPLPLR